MAIEGNNAIVLKKMSDGDNKNHKSKSGIFTSGERILYHTKNKKNSHDDKVLKKYLLRLIAWRIKEMMRFF